MKKKAVDIELILNEKGVKPTAVRKLVLSKFYENDNAFSLSSLSDDLEWSDQSTIFRTLKTFVEKGLLHSIDNGSDSKYYALCNTSCSEHRHRDFHPHFKCSKCGKTFCLNDSTMPNIEIPEGFVLKNLTLNIDWICEHCS